MARKTDGERIDDLRDQYSELDKFVAVMLEQLTSAIKTLEALRDAHSETTQHHADLRREFEREIAVLKQQLEELRRWSERNGTSEIKAELGRLTDRVGKVESAQEKVSTRAWSVVPNILGALVSGLIAALVAYFVARK
jgi:chromosome segregation ATPase